MGKSTINHNFQELFVCLPKGTPPKIAIWLWINTYENTIFRGMNIHLPTSYFDVHQGDRVLSFDPSPFKSSWSHLEKKTREHIDIVVTFQ